VNYLLTQHAKDALAERGIALEWMERVLDSPEKTEPDPHDPQLVHHLGKIPEHENRVLRVILNKQVDPVRIVTVFFDRRARGRT
jgi:hypothetical protein